MQPPLLRTLLGPLPPPLGAYVLNGCPSEDPAGGGTDIQGKDGLYQHHDRHGHLLGEDVGHDVDGVRLGFAGGGSGEKDFKKSYHILGQ